MPPYFDQYFFGFFRLFFYRLLTGEMSPLMPDEIQASVLMVLAASSALVGSFLVLRKMTMLANSLSHTVLLGIVIAYLLVGGGIGGEHLQLNLPSLLVASLLMGLFTVFLTEWLTQSVRLQEDAATGLVFTTLFALGLLAVTVFTRSAHIGTESVMGNVDALHADDLKLALLIFALNASTILLFYKEFKITSFDPLLAQTLGISPLLFNYLLMGEASFAIIGSFRSTGVLMVLAFLVIPPLTARLFTHRLHTLILLSIAFGSLTSLISVALSRHLLSVHGIAVSTAGLTTTLMTTLFALSALWQKALPQRFTNLKSTKLFFY